MCIALALSFWLAFFFLFFFHFFFCEHFHCNVQCAVKHKCDMGPTTILRVPVCLKCCFHCTYISWIRRPESWLHPNAENNSESIRHKCNVNTIIFEFSAWRALFAFENSARITWMWTQTIATANIAHQYEPEETRDRVHIGVHCVNDTKISKCNGIILIYLIKLSLTKSVNFRLMLFIPFIGNAEMVKWHSIDNEQLKKNTMFFITLPVIQIQPKV